MANTVKKKEGFQGQKAIVIPRPLLSSKCAKNDIINKLYITDIGYYPKARYHYRERIHGADQCILIYCHEGYGRVSINSTEVEIGPGEFFTIPSNTKHLYAASDESPWTIYWVHFKGSVSDQLVTHCFKKNGAKGFVKASDRPIEMFNEIYNKLERGYGVDNLIHANMSFWYFLTTILNNENVQTQNKLADKNVIDMAIDFLRKNIDKMITLEEIANAANLSTSHFSAIFKKKTGFTAIEYFNHLKVQKACQYLLFTDQRVKEISETLGIEDQHYFSRLFTKVMGISPYEYRKRRIH